MVNPKKSLNKQRKPYQSLVATALLTGSFFQFVAPVLADGTGGGQSISNTATATYEDPNAPGTTINATSNTVTVTVAEVAGITVTASGVTDTTTSPTNTTVQVGDLLTYTYTLTNVGNDPSKFHIPNQATTTGPGTVSGVLPADKNNATPASGTLQYSTDGGVTWTNVTAGGVDTPSIPVSGTVLVRVPVTVQTGAQSNDVIKVTLGNTPGDAQNQLRSPDGGDVYTVDNADTAGNGEVAGAPINGTREASITQQTQVGNTVKTVALATILKTRTGYNAGVPSVLNDDVLTYGLSLQVKANDPNYPALTAGDLTGTTINVNGSPVTRILVSDALPASTTLNAIPTAPPGWIVVYTADPTTTTADQAQWNTTAPANVTRVGFINNPSSISTVGAGTTVTGFSVQVKTTGITGTTANVNNIAQVFGKTAGDVASAVLFDDSGDQNPDNINPTTGAFPTTPDSGYYPGTVTAAQTDTGNNNQGANSVTGDVNVYTVSVAQANSVLNGPNNAPDATGPSGLTNDDFTNKSAFVPPNTAPGSTLDPQSVGFTNTIKNNGTATNDITIVPTAPGTLADLPNLTKVTVSYNNQSAVYTYNSTTGVFAIATGNTPIKVSGVLGGASVNYGLEVDLPAGTPLSTDTNKGFPVPITAFIDTNTDGVVNTGEVNNISIDRVYTGFLQLLKVSRVLQGTGPVVGAGQGDFESTPAYTNPTTTTVIDPNPGVADVPRNPAPGNIIEYQVRYKNISDAQAGTGNVILNANKVVISEDGTLSTALNDGKNNWALDNDKKNQIDTSNVVGSAKDSGASTIQFFIGNPATNPGIDQTGTTVNTDVTRYVNSTTGQVAPGVQRTFTFQRKVN